MLSYKKKCVTTTNTFSQCGRMRYSVAKSVAAAFGSWKGGVEGLRKNLRGFTLLTEKKNLKKTHTIIRKHKLINCIYIYIDINIFL